MAGLPDVWGATRAEAERGYPADSLLPSPVRLLTRAVTVDAPPGHVYRWLCQVALGPYSYDWIDNWGRRSPRELVPGADRLAVGQPMAIFRLTSYEEGRSWTGLIRRGPERVFGPVAVTYAAETAGAATRIVCRLAVPARRGWRRLPLDALSWGDLLMMRKQLRTLKELAERSCPGDVSA